MSTEESTSTPSEEELRAAYEAEVKKIRVEQVLLENVVSLVNLGMRRSGLAPGTEDERDIDQVRLSIESVRALLPLLERSSPEHARPIRDALSQLQLAFVKIGGSGRAGTEGGGEPSPGTGGGGPAGGSGPSPEPQRQAPKPGEPGPAQRSGRLWVPGQ
jgi:uncharacterized membrane protein YgcG